MCLEWCKISHQVRIAAKVMFAHGGIYIAFAFTHQQFVCAQQVKEFIPSYIDVILFKKWLQHDVQFSCAAPRLQFPVQAYLFQYQSFLHL